MKSFSIASTDEVYNCCQTLEITAHRISAPELRSFSFSLERLLKSLGDMSKEEFWQPIIRQLKRFRFDFSAAPLSDPYLRDKAHTLAIALQSNLMICSRVYPELEKPFSNVVTLLRELEGKKIDYLLEYTKELVAKHRSTAHVALLIREARLIPLIEKDFRSIADLKHCEVISPEDVHNDTCYQVLLTFGPSHWFPEYVFSAPRATQIYRIRYQWVRDTWKLKEVLPAPLHFTESKKSFFSQLADGENPDEELINDEILLPIADFQKIERKAADSLKTDNDDDHIEARVFLLEQDWGVFLETDESAYILVIDLDEAVSDRVKRVKIGDVEKGTYILLRRGGGGDYIVPVANNILGDKAFDARNCQRRWKKLLREWVKRYGLNTVANHLAANGSLRASETNIRNWISERGIRPHDKHDFKAIMQLVSLEAEADSYWQIMGQINSAHHKAGMLIRNLLLEQVEKNDLKDLQRTGKMDFELVGENTGSLTAFRVRDIYPSTLSVAISKIGEPFKLEAEE